MFLHSVDRAFRRFQQSGDSKALAFVFDATAPDLQGLARYLASPEAPAEDLLQATYLSAIESKQSFDATQRVLPWLVGILANHAREARRRSQRVLDPQRIRSEVGLDPSDEASGSELSGTLDQAIARLPETYRSVLRLYLQHGLEPAEIARSLERPQGTVRAQLNRGLKRLRRLLPESLVASQAYAFVSSSRLTAIRAAVLEKCGGHALPIAGSALSLGFLAMSFNKKLLLAAGVLLAAFLAYTFRGEPSFDGAPRNEGEVARAEVQPAASAIDTSPAASPESRTQVSLPQEPTLSKPAAPPTTGSLHVHISDSKGTPVADVGLAVRDAEKLSLGSMLDFVRTNASGDVIFEDLAPSRVFVDCDRNSLLGVSQIVAGQQTELAVQLGGMRVEGSVVDDHGTPMVGATIWAHAERLESVVIAQTDARGEFHVEHVSPQLGLQARKEGFAPSKAHPVLGKEDESWHVQLALEGEATEVTGRVLDPSGAPVADALVSFVPDAAKDSTPFGHNGPQIRAVQVRTDAEGTFRSREIPRGVIIATAAGRNQEWTPASTRLEVGIAPQRLDLRLGIGATLVGRIMQGGKPRRDCTITAFCSQPDMPTSYIFNLLAMRSARSDRQGEFRIVGILPGQVQLNASRNDVESKGMQTITMTAGETRRWDLEFDADNGGPFEITIEPAAPPVKGGFWLVRTMGSDESNLSSLGIKSANEAGRVKLERLTDGHYNALVYWRLESGDMIPMLSREFDARERKLTLVIPAERLHLQAVRGRVVDLSGNPVKERTVQAHSMQDGEAIALQRATAVDGTFAFAGLPPGRYVVSLLDGDAITVLREFTVVGDRAEELGDLKAP